MAPAPRAEPVNNTQRNKKARAGVEAGMGLLLCMGDQSRLCLRQKSFDAKYIPTQRATAGTR